MLSVIAQKRKTEIEQWFLRSLESRVYRELGSYSMGRTRGAIMRKRLFMIVGQVQIEPDITTNKHILDDEDNWRIFQKEMHIPSEIFYGKCNTSPSYPDEDGGLVNSWISIVLREMERYFYRSKLIYENGIYQIYPVKVEYPDFGALGFEEILQAVGIIGGESLLSNDTSLKELKYLKNGVEVNISVSQSTGPEFRDNLRNGIETIYEFSSVLTTDEKARVELSEPITILANVSNGRMPFKVIAEDDTEQVYAINVTRI